MSDVHQGQPSGLVPLDEPGDAELISAVRGGDLDSYGLLFARHVDSARRLARQLVSAGDVDDLVSDAFAKVLSVLQKGGGPDLAFRAYLLTSLRRLHVDKMRAGARLTTTDDMTAYDPGIAFEDTAISGFDNAAAAKAFASLPERWQQVLWHTEVEGQKPAEVAPLLGISANSVSALAYRAREGLRQAFISMHAQDAAVDACATARANLGAYLRGGISRRDGAKVEEHLGGCRECSAIYLELTEVNNDLGAVLAPMLLGSAGAGYLAAAHVGAIAATKGGVLLFLDRGKDWVLHNPVGRVAAGSTGVVAAVVAAAALSYGGSSPQAAPTTRPPASSPSTAPATQATAPPPSKTATQPAGRPPATATATTPPVAPATSAATTLAPLPSAPRSGLEIRTPLRPVVARSSTSPVTIDLTKGAVAPNGYPIRIRSASVTRPSHGTVVIDRAAARVPAGRALAPFAARTVTPSAAPSTTVTYTPDAGWRGTDTITYVLTDGHGGTARGSVEVRTPNTPPVAGDDSARASNGWLTTATPISIDVLANDSDANHDALAIKAVTKPEHGRATIVGDTIRYTPPVGSDAASDTFGYTVRDGHGGTAHATVTVHLGALPDRAPVAGSFTASTAYGSPVTVALSAHASDPDGDLLSYSIANGPAHGTVEIGTDGAVTYTPSAGYSGPDSFGYTATDPAGASASGTVALTVDPLSSDLALLSHPITVGGSYEHVHLSVRGIPADHTASFHIHITGITGWTAGQTDALGPVASGCTLPTAPSGTLDLTCTVDRDGELLHLDFDVSDPWSVDASLTPQGFVDSTGGDTTFRRATGDTLGS
ncbi:MAG: sigma-70 family RNA polymerase sigma factor [Nocardioides sp.]